MPWLGLAAALGLGAVAGCGGGDTGSGGGNSTNGGGGQGASSSSGSTNPSTGGTGGEGVGGTGGTGGVGGTGGETGGSGGAPPQCVGPIAPDHDGTPPQNLEDTGLYTDIAHATLSTHVSEYAPQYALWADGDAKGRWAYIPPSCVIDNHDEDHWDFPVGTRFWKEFENTTDGVTKKIETRMIEHYAPGPQAWLFVAYQWNAAQDAATLVPAGMEVYDALGTSHDIPASPGQCLACHGTNEKGHVNGFSAIQLSGTATGLNLAALNSMGMLMVPDPTGHPVPGNATEQAALGYLHANCGHCHNETGMIALNAFKMRLRVSDTTVAVTDTVVTGVSKPSTHCVGENRLEPGHPETSCVIFRMDARGDASAPMYDPSPDQMPPLATKLPDATGGVAVVTTWIQSL